MRSLHFEGQMSKVYRSLPWVSNFTGKLFDNEWKDKSEIFKRAKHDRPQDCWLQNCIPNIVSLRTHPQLYIYLTFDVDLSF